MGPRFQSQYKGPTAARPKSKSIIGRPDGIHISKMLVGARGASSQEQNLHSEGSWHSGCGRMPLQPLYQEFRGILIRRGYPYPWGTSLPVRGLAFLGGGKFRGRPVMTLLEGVRTKVMDMIHKRHDKGLQWTKEIMLNILKKANEQMELNRQRNLHVASNTEFEVLDKNSWTNLDDVQPSPILPPPLGDFLEGQEKATKWDIEADVPLSQVLENMRS
ncbi:hypothetical protein Salat_2516000 [Sesamum alatum]|uniref:Uncharacterized protein n=1 Tax=Sesamum alatum TaxID=300844 RepID=A0AAE1XRZ2_9LAMI|nr:hypothetical protein Salat_2516000 [Sesamum alatum]